MKFKRILVALDRSPRTEEVLNSALDLVQGDGSLLLVHGLNIDQSGHTGPFLGIGTLADVDVYSALRQHQREQIHNQRAETEAWLQRYCHDISALRGLEAEAICEIAEPGPLICDFANRWQADLIVIGRRGHTGLAEMLLGSVSNYVVHQAPCAVLIVQHDAVFVDRPGSEISSMQVSRES
jgi:nucleotide-binding universal stress UspA family protein